MSDFLCSIGNRYKGQDLLNLIKKPYGGHAPKGQAFDFPWGQIAILEEHLANNSNILAKDGAVFAWVGDLVTDHSDRFVDVLIKRIIQLRNHYREVSLESDAVFGKLNGAFAVVLADNGGFSVITDPLSFTQVYVGNDVDNSPLCVGTHPDLVSALCGSGSRIDTVSVGEFLSQGTTRFPHTMYENVKELNPARLYSVEAREPSPRIRSVSYWMPPAEIRGDYKVDQLAEELEEALLSSVRDRCLGEKVGITLSGGQDSRLIMAAVPKSVECIGLTFCDYINREARIAKRVCECYGRDWVPIFREKGFLADCLLKTVRLQGCEFDFVDAHAVGVAEHISRLGFSSILGGMQMDVYLKGYFATDWLCRKRMKGLLTDKYERTHCDYTKGLAAFESQILTEEVVSRILLRRQQSYSEHVDCSRGSISEWLIMYPFSQDKIGACWAAERRILPMKLVATDRRLLDFAFRCPIELKLGKRIFMEAALSIYGPGVRIPNVDDGVRPGSGHWSRLFQRAIRKSQNRTTRILEKLGKEPRVQGSWHDYQKYWRESEKLDQLRQQYGANLNQFDGILFKDSGQELLENKDLDWHYGFRLLQLAVWLGIIGEYRNVLKGRSS
ncbi:MAG: asparagine synthase-related protein [Planctomycetota bacterium]|jgi:asparagine synthase (glutamine-hydrolysing)